MVNKDLLDKLDSLGFGADIDSLEKHISLLQDCAGLGKPIVTDTQYDMYVKLLRELKPDSTVLNRNWEIDDNDLSANDTILLSNKMYSIKTIQDKSETNKFVSKMPDRVSLFASSKLNGHAVRAVYKYGKLVSGSTRGRLKKGRDITKHMLHVLPNYISQWSNIDLVEVRGEMLVSLDNFEKIRYNHALKTPLSAVTSLIRDSVTDKELDYLSCVCYRVILSENSNVHINSLEEQFKLLLDLGFEIPPCKRYDGVTKGVFNIAFDKILSDFESLYDRGIPNYATDGIVVSVNDAIQFKDMGIDGNSCVGNFAIKMGKYWECNIYKSKILDIEYEYGKKYITPKAIIAPTVTSNGAEVSTVPLYNVGVMNRFNLIPGEEIYFRFGGETGVTLCNENGDTIGDLA